MNVPYELNVQKAIRNKVKACDLIDLDVCNKGGNIIIQLNTASFELARAVVTNYYINDTQLYTCEITNKTYETGNIVEDILRVANRKGRACKGGCLFTINFYRTTCKIMVNGKNKNKFYVNDLALIKDLFNKERDNILLVNNFVKVMASGSNVTNVSVPSKSVESTNNTSLSTTIFASNSIDNAREPEQNLNNIISTSSTNDSILNCYDPLPLNNFMSKPINDIILSLGTTQSSSCTCACAQKLGEVLLRLDKLAGEIETIKTAVSAHVVRGVDVGVNTCSSVTPLNALSPCTFNMLSPTASSFPISTSSVDLDLNHQTVSSSSFISLCETSSSSVTFTPALLNTDTVTIPSSPVSPRVSDCVNLPSGSSIPISQTSLSQPLVRSTEATPIALPVVNKGLSKSSDAIRSHVKSASRIESVAPSSRLFRRWTYFSC